MKGKKGTYEGVPYVNGDMKTNIAVIAIVRTPRANCGSADLQIALRRASRSRPRSCVRDWVVIGFREDEIQNTGLLPNTNTDVQVG